METHVLKTNIGLHIALKSETKECYVEPNRLQHKFIPFLKADCGSHSFITSQKGPVIFFTVICFPELFFVPRLGWNLKMIGVL